MLASSSSIKAPIIVAIVVISVSENGSHTKQPDGVYNVIESIKHGMFFAVFRTGFLQVRLVCLAAGH